MENVGQAFQPADSKGRLESLPHVSMRRRSRGYPAAARGASVIGNHGGVRHEKADALDRHAEFLGGGLGQLRARPLADFNFARQNGDDAIRPDVETLCQVRGPVLRGPLSEQARNGHGKDHAGADDLDELAPADLEMIERSFLKFVTFRLGELGLANRRFHCASFLGCAARCTALRTFTYPQHRQRFPFSASTICVWFGLGLRLISATVARIMPGTQ